MREEYEITTETYEKKYGSGYGLQYPDGHVIRVHRQILEYELGISGGKILDYGCGTGTHLLYFQQNNYTPYGCDISVNAIKQCKALMSDYADNFFKIPNLPRLRDYFSEDFDVIFSNQVIYYLDDDDLDDLLSQFKSMLRQDGVLFATMIAPTNYYSRFVVSSQGSLSKVTLEGRLEETTWINFKTKDEWLDLFTTKGFTKVQFGLYSTVIREDEGPTDHYIFVGRKK
jgi:SAM-dependent methyltransferase